MRTVVVTLLLLSCLISVFSAKITFSYGEYDGELSPDDLPHGQGTMHYINGDFYSGNFELGVKSGEGYYKWISGNEYEGQYMHNLPHGEGIARNFVSGEIYDGDWVQGKRSGYGVKIYPRDDDSFNQEKYEGHWLNNLRNGYGTMYFSNGDLYKVLYAV